MNGIGKKGFQRKKFGKQLLDTSECMRLVVYEEWKALKMEDGELVKKHTYQLLQIIIDTLW